MHTTHDFDISSKRRMMAAQVRMGTIHIKRQLFCVCGACYTFTSQIPSPQHKQETGKVAISGNKKM